MPIGILEKNEKVLKVPDPSWVVACRHTDGTNEDFKLANVLDLKPNHKDDFKYGYKYTARSKKWYKDGLFRLYKVYVGRIEENEEKLEVSKTKARLKYPPPDPRSFDEMGTENELEQPYTPRESNSASEKKKRAAADKELENLCQFVSSNVLCSPSTSGSKSDDHFLIPKKPKLANSVVSSSSKVISSNVNSINNDLSVSSASSQPGSPAVSKTKSCQQKNYNVDTDQNHLKTVPCTLKKGPRSLFANASANDDVDVFDSVLFSASEPVSCVRDVNTEDSGAQLSFDSGFNSNGAISNACLSTATEIKILSEGPPGVFNVVTETPAYEDYEKLKRELQYYKSLASEGGVVNAIHELKHQITKIDGRLGNLETSMQSKLKVNKHNSVARWLNECDFTCDKYCDSSFP